MGTASASDFFPRLFFGVYVADVVNVVNGQYPTYVVVAVFSPFSDATCSTKLPWPEILFAASLAADLRGLPLVSFYQLSVLPSGELKAPPLRKLPHIS